MQPTASSPSRNRPVPIPTSFGGVAATSERPGPYLLGWQILFALGTAILAVWALELAWGRAFRHAVSALPEQGRIQDGLLEWPDANPNILFQGPFIAIVVDPQGLRENGLATDVTLSLESDRLAVRSFLGWAAVPYPPSFRLSLTRVDMTSAVAAWRAPFFLAVGTSVVVLLFASWIVLSLVYGVVVWIAAAVLGRSIPFRTARRLAGASLLPGCLLMGGAIALYATRQLGLEGVLVAWPLHVVLGWIYCAGAWTRLSVHRKSAESVLGNPFATADEASASHPTPPGRPSVNPFQNPG